MLQRNGLFRDTPQSNAAIAAFNEIAYQHDIAPTTLALAWVNQVDGVSSTIIGATTLAQLKANIAAFSFTLDNALNNELDAFLRQYPQPF